MVRREHFFISVTSAVLGGLLMLLALGGNRGSGIEGWIPLNDSVAAVMSEQGNQEAVKLQDSDLQNVTPVNAMDTDAKAIDVSVSHTTSNNTSEAGMQKQDGRISINNAGMTELQEIPGIGEKKAQAIIDYRTAHGPFRSVDELTNIKGIGDKILEKMKPHIRL